MLFAVLYLMFFALSSPDSNGDITVLIIYYQQSGILDNTNYTCECNESISYVCEIGLLFVDQSLGGIVKDVLVPILNLEINAQSGTLFAPSCTHSYDIHL
jgi:hypothetical protein